VTRLPPTILGFKHVLREHWFENNANSYKECSATESEDPSCSKGFLLPSIPDHLEYLGYDMKAGWRFGCE
jgi:hypothetical protein